jgi:hypothetical protein
MHLAARVVLLNWLDIYRASTVQKEGRPGAQEPCACSAQISRYPQVRARRSRLTGVNAPVRKYLQGSACQESRREWRKNIAT